MPDFAMCSERCPLMYKCRRNAASGTVPNGTRQAFDRFYPPRDPTQCKGYWPTEKVIDMNLVIIESPYAGSNERQVASNVCYAQFAMQDCLERGEAPYASHLLYTQDNVLDDKQPEQRTLGIEAGLRWGHHAQKTIVYTDLGITEGMRVGIKRAQQAGREVEHRKLPQDKFDQWVSITGGHSAEANGPCTCFEDTFKGVKTHLEHELSCDVIDLEVDWEGRSLMMAPGEFAPTNPRIAYSYRPLKKQGGAAKSRKKDTMTIIASHCCFCGRKYERPKKAEDTGEDHG